MWDGSPFVNTYRTVRRSYAWYFAPIGSSSDDGASRAPQPLRRQPRPLGEHTEFLPHDARMHARGREALREAAVNASDDILASHDLRVAQDPLGHQLRVLDAVRRVRDNTRNDDLALGKLEVLPDVILMLVTRVRRLERERACLDLEDHWRDLA